jgi:two-component system response regulator CpxR
MSLKKTILCVEDDQSLSIHKVMLETRGYRVVTCNTAADAVNIFRPGGVDLVLSQANLPDAAAVDLVRHIKALSPEVPVIVLSTQMPTLHTDAPVDLLLRKGTFAPAELLEHIRILLVKRRGPHRAQRSAASERRAQAI